MKQRPERNFSDPVCQPFHMPGDRHGVLLLHGFTGSAAHMRPLGEALHGAGFTVEGINLPGHGQSMEAMGKTGWQDWLDAGKEAFLRLKKDCDYVSVAGLSMGGCIALLIAETLQPTAIATISAPMAVLNPLLPLAGIAAPFIPRILWRSREGTPYPVDDRYDYGYPGFPTRCGSDLNRLIRMARRDLHAVQCPVLAIQSRQDDTVSRDSAEVIVNGVSSDRAGVLWLENVPHVCTISAESGRIAEAVTWLFREAEQHTK